MEIKGRGGGGGGRYRVESSLTTESERDGSNQENISKVGFVPLPYLPTKKKEIGTEIEHSDEGWDRVEDSSHSSEDTRR